MENLEALKACGLGDESAQEALSLKAPAESKGLSWLTILSLLRKYGPLVVEILKELLARQEATEQTPPPPIPQR